MQQRLCACNHFEGSHGPTGCRGWYGLTPGRTTACDCTEFRPLTAEQTAAMDAMERLMGGIRPPAM